MKLMQTTKEMEREQRLWSQVGARLKIARKASLLSQAEMAKKLGISRARWSMYELGKRPIRMTTLKDAVELTSVTWGFVIYGDELDVAKDVRSRMRQARQLEYLGDGG